MSASNYNKEPVIVIEGYNHETWVGYGAIAEQVADTLRLRCGRIIAIECYPGVREDEILRGISPVLQPSKVIHAIDAAMAQDELESLVARYLTDDRVFARLH